MPSLARHKGCRIPEQACFKPPRPFSFRSVSATFIGSSCSFSPISQQTKIVPQTTKPNTTFPKFTTTIMHRTSLRRLLHHPSQTTRNHHHQQQRFFSIITQNHQQQSPQQSFSQQQQQETTHFGFQTVPEQQKQQMVFDVFANVANKYDIMNDLMSGSLHRMWKDVMIEEHYRPQPGCTLLDVAGGTGDIAFRIIEYLRRRHLEQQQQQQQPNSASPSLKSKVIISDINPNMLQVGRQKATELGLDHIPSVELDWLEGNAECLSSIESESVDGYTIAFGIRNVTHVDRALKEAHRILKKGGHFLCLEFSRVDNDALRQFYDWYSFNVIPSIGEVVTNDRASYQYLVESIRQFPDQETFKGMLEDAGFKHTKYTSMSFGVVALHSGIKL